MVREKRERRKGEGRSVKDDNTDKGERKTAMMTTSVFHQSIVHQSHLLTHKIQTTTEDIDRGSVVQIIVMMIGEINAGDLVHVAHRGGHPATTTLIADAQGRVRRLTQKKGGRRNIRKGSGIVIETVPAERRAAALQSQWIQRRKKEEDIVDAEEAELQLNRQRGTIYLAFLK